MGTVTANDVTSKLERRVVIAAEAALDERGFVSAIDVLVGVGWLTVGQVDQWRQGRVEFLERVTTVNLHKLSAAMAVFGRWATARGLLPSGRRMLPALGIVVSCGSVEAGIPGSNAPTGRIGCHRSCPRRSASGWSSAGADHPISSWSRR